MIGDTKTYFYYFKTDNFYREDKRKHPMVLFIL